MVNYLRRLISKLSPKWLLKIDIRLVSIVISAFLFVSIIIILIVGRLIGSSISSSLPDAMRQFQELSGYQISVSEVRFGIPGRITIRNLSINDQEKSIISIDNLRISMSLFAALKNEVVINAICMTGVYLPKTTLDKKDEIIHSINEFFGRFYCSGFKVKIKASAVDLRDIRLVFTDGQEGAQFIILNSRFYAKGNNLICKGSINMSNLHINLEMLERMRANIIKENIYFYIDIVPYEDNLLINNSKILTKDFKILGSGIVYNFKKEPYLDIKLISNPLNFNEAFKAKSNYYLSGLLNLSSKLYGRAKSPKFETEITLLDSYIYFAKSIFRLGDISCSLYIGKDGIEIKEFTAVVDDRFPFFLSGNIQNILTPEFDIEITSTLRRSVMLNIANDADLNVSLSLRKTSKSLDGKVIIAFIKKGRGGKKYFSRKVISQFSNIGLNMRSLTYAGKKGGGSNLLGVKAESLDILEKSLSNNKLVMKEAFKFNNLSLNIIFDPGFLTIKDFSCYGYDGLIRAYGNINLRQKPYVYSLSLVLNNIEINKLRRFYPIDCNLLGKMSGRILFQNTDTDYTKGIITVKDAHLDGLEPLNQTADFLGIDAIKQIEHANVITEFSSDKDGFNINKFDLNAEGIAIKSHFYINKEDWIKGKISLSLLRDFLAESDRFRLLLNLSRERSHMVDFDFRVVGSSGGLRIQLLEGEFRNKLIERLSQDIKDRIELEINKVLDSMQSDQSEAAP
jgi:hypothetical protein